MKYDNMFLLHLLIAFTRLIGLDGNRFSLSYFRALGIAPGKCPRLLKSKMFHSIWLWCNMQYADLMQNMTMDLLGSSRDHTFYGPYKGPRFTPQI